MLLALLAAAILGASSALALAACGSDDEQGTESVAVEEAESVDVRLTDTEIEPDDVNVRAGVIEFVVRNDGDGEHAFAVETSEGGVKETDPIAPGETARLKIDLRPGTYEMYDPIGENRARGLEGKVDVDERKTDTVTTTDETTATDQETVTETDERTETDTEQRTVTETDERTVTETETTTETTTAP